MPRKHKPKSPLTFDVLDLSYHRAASVFVGDFDRLTLCLIGCGGSGSWLAPSLARLARVLTEERHVQTDLMFVDPDVIEAGNIFRQHFCDAEVGRPKAEALAARYGMAWGVEICAVVAPFDKALVSPHYSPANRLVVLVGCVDNAHARKAIAEALQFINYSHDVRPVGWWLDCGNSWASGQVLLGSATRADQLARSFALPKKCSALPAPSLQHPDLLRPRPEETGDGGLSCEEILARNAQSLTVNQMTASIAADYLTGLLLGQDLKCFASYFDLGSKSTRSRPITPEAIAESLHQSPERLFAPNKKPL